MKKKNLWNFYKVRLCKKLKKLQGKTLVKKMSLTDWLTDFKMKKMVSLYIKYHGMSPSYDSSINMIRYDTMRCDSVESRMTDR